MPAEITDLTQELCDLRRDMERSAVPGSDRSWRMASRAIERIEKALARPLRISVFGEDKAGKSSLINFLLKQEALPSGGTISQGTCLRIHFADETAMYCVGQDGSRTRLTTKAVTRLAQPETSAPPLIDNVIYSADEPVRAPSFASSGFSHLVSGPSVCRAEGCKLIELGMPHELLRSVEMVESRCYPKDTLNSVAGTVFQPIDIAIWCTLATQAWKQSERAAWCGIPEARRKKALLLVTYKEAIRQADEARILTRLRREASTLFSDIILVSLRDALRAEICEDEELAAALRRTSNAELVEKALSMLARGWYQERQRKAVWQILMVAKTLRSGNQLEAAQRLETIAADYSPRPAVAATGDAVSGISELLPAR